MATFFIDAAKLQMKSLEHEARLRGIVAAVSADMESLLLRLILYTIVDKPTEAFRNFKNLTMGKKLKWAEKDLKRFDMPRYLKHQQDFEELWEFNTLRGQLIHCIIRWPDEPNFFQFDIIDIQKIGEEWRMIPIRYTKLEVIQKVMGFRDLILRFAETCKDLIEEVHKKYPDLIRSSKA